MIDETISMWRSHTVQQQSLVLVPLLLLVWLQLFEMSNDAVIVSAAGVGFRVNLRGERSKGFLSKFRYNGVVGSGKRGKKNVEPADDDVGEFGLGDMIQVDFRGQLESHILGSSSNEEQRRRRDSVAVATQPLIRILLPKCPVNVFAGCHYDFSRRWYGATSLIGRVNISLNGQDGGCFRKRLTPASVDVCGERQLLDARLMAGEVAVAWQGARSLLLSQEPEAEGGVIEPLLTTLVRTRVDSAGQSALSVSIPLHRRLQYRCTLCRNSLPASAVDDVLPELTQALGTWWAPDLSLGAGGDLEAYNGVILPHPLRGAGGRLDFRLYAARRRSATFADDGEAPSTILSLELSDVTVKSVTGIRLEAQLERPLESAQLCIIQQLKRRCEPISPKKVVQHTRCKLKEVERHFRPSRSL